MKTVYYFIPAMFGSNPPPQKKKNGMSRWGLAKILDRYIIQVLIIIFSEYILQR